MKTPFISDLNSEQTITSFFLVCEKELRNTREGKPYLRLELGLNARARRQIKP